MKHALQFEKSNYLFRYGQHGNLQLLTFCLSLGCVVALIPTPRTESVSLKTTPDRFALTYAYNPAASPLSKRISRPMGIILMEHLKKISLWKNVCIGKVEQKIGPNRSQSSLVFHRCLVLLHLEELNFAPSWFDFRGCSYLNGCDIGGGWRDRSSSLILHRLWKTDSPSGDLFR